MKNSINRGIVHDVVKLTLKGKLFTTDGKLITLKSLSNLVLIEDDDEPTKLDFNKLQTSHYFGYDTTLSYVFNRYEYDIETVSFYINSEVTNIEYKGTNKYSDEVDMINWFFSFYNGEDEDEDEDWED